MVTLMSFLYSPIGLITVSILSGLIGAIIGILVFISYMMGGGL